MLLSAFGFILQKRFLDFCKTLIEGVVTTKMELDETIEKCIPEYFGRYRKIRKIGSGAFSVVILVENVKTHEQFAAKAVTRQALISEGIFDRFEQELRLMQSFDHPNIVKVFDIVYLEEIIFLVMEYCAKGELFNYIVQRGVLADFQIKKILRQIVSALNYLHDRNIAHRDIKPENILLDADTNVKLADFGLCHSTSKNQMLMTPCGSPFYAPPEIVANQPYDGKKGDMWSLGVVLFSMATGSLPWTEMNQTQLLQQIMHADFVVPVTVSPDIRALIQALMSANPSARPSSKDVLSLPWLNEQTHESIRHNKLSKVVPATHAMRTQVITGATSSMVHKKQIIVRPNCSSTPKPKMTCSFELSPIMGLVRKVPASIHNRNTKDDFSVK